MIEHERVLAAMQTQAGRIERLERELADEKAANASVIKNWEDALSQCVRLEAKLGAIQALANANANRAA